MEDFFKNKLNDFDGGGDGWDRPDREVWDRAQEQFPEYPVKKERDWRLLAVVLLALLTLLLGGYAFYLSQKVGDLDERLEVAVNELEEVNAENFVLKNDQENKEEASIVGIEKLTNERRSLCTIVEGTLFVKK